MSPPNHLCIFPGCHSVQGNGAVSLFKFPKEDNVRTQWIDFVKRSFCEEFKITTNTRLCSVRWRWSVVLKRPSPSPACILPSSRQHMLLSPPQALCARLRPSRWQQVLSSGCACPPESGNRVSTLCPSPSPTRTWLLTHVTSLPETQEESKNMYFY